MKTIILFLSILSISFTAFNQPNTVGQLQRNLQECYNQCGTCQAGQEDVCDTCSDSERSMPECNCPEGKFDDHENSACQQCPINCATCSSLSTCLSCSGSYRVSTNLCACESEYEESNGTCALKPCPSGQYRHDTRCINCFKVEGDDTCYEAECPFLHEKNTDSFTCVPDKTAWVWLIIFLVLTSLLMFYLIFSIVRSYQKQKKQEQDELREKNGKIKAEMQQPEENPQAGAQESQNVGDLEVSQIQEIVDQSNNQFQIE